MEADQNPFPEIKVVKCPPPFPGVARAIARVFRSEAPICESDHYVREHFTDEPVEPPVTQPAQKWE